MSLGIWNLYFVYVSLSRFWILFWYIRYSVNILSLTFCILWILFYEFHILHLLFTDLECYESCARTWVDFEISQFNWPLPFTLQSEQIHRTHGFRIQKRGYIIKSNGVQNTECKIPNTEYEYRMQNTKYRIRIQMTKYIKNVKTELEYSLENAEYTDFRILIQLRQNTNTECII